MDRRLGRSRRLTLVAALVIAGCGAVAGCGGSEHPSRDAASLDADWLDGETTITAAHLQRVMALGSSDPEIVALFQEAEKRIGGGSFEGLAARFSVCGPDVKSEGGLTQVKSSDAWMSRPLEELALGKRSPKTVQDLAEAEKIPVRDRRVVTYPDFLFVERTLLPNICIVARIPLVDAYDAVVHELVHATRVDPHATSELAAKSREDGEYRTALVLLPGGEADAYRTGVRARLRMGYLGNRRSGVQDLFDPASAELRAPVAALAERILAPRPGGLGYADGLFRNAFEEGRHSLLEELSAKRSLVEQVLAERRANIAISAANIDIHTQNIEGSRHNLGVGTATKNAALIQQSRAGIEADQRGLAESHAMLDAAHASETRLLAELTDLTGRLETLNP
jgi:hypothetical protein